MFSFNVQANNIFPCLHTIRRFYNIKTDVRALSIRTRMST